MTAQDDYNNVLFLSKVEKCRESEIKFCARITSVMVSDEKHKQTVGIFQTKSGHNPSTTC